MKTWMLMIAAVALGGCAPSSIFDQRVTPERAQFGAHAIPVPPPPPAPRMEIVNPDPVPGIAPVVIEQVTGTWTFVTPPTVTRVERKTGEMSQFTLYNGRPEATDTPFVVITVSSEAKGMAELDPENYKVASSRVYALNGNVAQEWTGNTKTGRGFCELVIKKPGGKPGDVCHAMATVKNADEQKLALDILASIKWTANPAAPVNQSAGADTFIQLPDLSMNIAMIMHEDGTFHCEYSHRIGDGPWIVQN